MANDTRGNRQFSWLRQVAYRHDLLRQCSGVAIALTKYFNSEEDDGHGPRFTAFFDEGYLVIKAVNPLQLHQFGFRTWLLVELQKTKSVQEPSQHRCWRVYLT